MQRQKRNGRSKLTDTEREHRGLVTPLILNTYLIFRCFSLTKIASSRIQNRRHQTYFIDAYIIAWLLLEMRLLTTEVQPFIRCFVFWLVAFRIFDLVSATLGAAIFDPIVDPEGHRLASKARSLTWTLIGYVELICLFAILYTLIGSYYASFGSCEESFRALLSVKEGLYFSTITQLTIGYGDIQPIGDARFAVSIQGILGYLFVAVVVARVVSALPPLSLDFAPEHQGVVRATSIGCFGPA